jgi:hypothetical protein
MLEQFTMHGASLKNLVLFGPDYKKFRPVRRFLDERFVVQKRIYSFSIIMSVIMS